jgi:hypothetical protein
VTPNGIPASGELVAVSYKITIPASTDRLYVEAGWQRAASGVIEVEDLHA